MSWDGFMEWICRHFGHRWAWGLVYPNYCYRCGYVPNDEERYKAVTHRFI